MKLTLPTDSAERKNWPLLRGLFRYFPAGLARVANLSKRGNDKHNPGEEMYHARGKSTDHGDCILRHTMDAEDIRARMDREYRDATAPFADDADIDMLLEELTQRAWRSLADLQEACEKYGRAPLAPGARLPALPADDTRRNFAEDGSKVP